MGLDMRSRSGAPSMDSTATATLPVPPTRSLSARSATTLGARGGKSSLRSVWIVRRDASATPITVITAPIARIRFG